MKLRLGDKCPAIIRVCSELQENYDFPIPRDLMKKKKQKENYDDILREISLHHVIRKKGKPFSKQLKDFDSLFAKNLKTSWKVQDKDINEYRKTVIEASKAELNKYDVIFCTCSVSITRRVSQGSNVTQLIIDECGMSMEADSVIPLATFNTVKQVVLIGDHKQLQPIIGNRDAKALGLDRSLFERYSASDEGRIFMLDEQYRMVSRQNQKSDI